MTIHGPFDKISFNPFGGSRRYQDWYVCWDGHTRLIRQWEGGPFIVPQSHPMMREESFDILVHRVMTETYALCT